MTMLEIKDLHAKVGDKEILKGVNLVVDEGEVMAIMGPNGCGKSTLSAVITGNSTYTVTKGSISFKGKDLLKMSPDERANFGVFLACVNHSLSVGILLPYGRTCFCMSVHLPR